MRDDLSKLLGDATVYEPSQASLIGNIRDLTAIAEKIPVHFQSRFLDLVKETHPLEWREIVFALLKTSQGKFTTECINFLLENGQTDELAAALKKNSDFNSALQGVLKDILTKHGRVIFNGNGYSEEWHKEAAKRGLKNHRTTPDALPEIVAKSTIEVFERQGVLSKAELESREEIYTHSYVLAINTESKLVSDIAKTLLLPAALKYAADLTPVEKTKSGGKLRKEVIGLADELAAAIDALDAAREVSKSDTHAQAKHSCDKVLPAMLKVRAAADSLEEIVADEYWPLPSYQELLFLR